MMPFAAAVLAARAFATQWGGVATFGRVQVEPNGTNAVPSRVTAWLDARGPEQQIVDEIVDGVSKIAKMRADDEQVTVTVTAESVSTVVTFSADVNARMHQVLDAATGLGSVAVQGPVAGVGPVPDLGTGAGHDAGVLSSAVPTSMLFVRNPSGVSHSPEEFAERADCLAGVEALAAVMTDWVNVSESAEAS
jgi:N-carbamoyl-L-amino-acid hydrolase